MKLDQHTMLLPKRRKTQSNISPQKMQDKKSAQENSTTRLATATAHTASHATWCRVWGAMAVAPGRERAPCRFRRRRPPWIRWRRDAALTCSARVSWSTVADAGWREEAAPRGAATPVANCGARPRSAVASDGRSRGRCCDGPGRRRAPPAPRR